MGLDAPLEWIEWVDDVMIGRDGLRILDFSKRRSWGTAVEAGSCVFRIWSDQLRSRPAEMGCDLRHDKMRRWCQHSMVSIGPYELSLSPRVAKDWRQKEINPFVSETTESACIINIDIIMAIQHKLADHSRGRPEGSHFNYCHTEMGEGYSWNCGYIEV